MGRADELLAAAMADEDINGRPGVGEWQATTEPIELSTHPDGEVMVGNSVRMPLATRDRIKAIADARRMSASRLIRMWIDEGMERAENGEVLVDPVVELDRAATAIEQARRALRNRGRAA